MSKIHFSKRNRISKKNRSRRFIQRVFAAFVVVVIAFGLFAVVRPAQAKEVGANVSATSAPVQPCRIINTQNNCHHYTMVISDLPKGAVVTVLSGDALSADWGSKTHAGGVVRVSWLGHHLDLSWHIDRPRNCDKTPTNTPTGTPSGTPTGTPSGTPTQTCEGEDCNQTTTTPTITKTPKVTQTPGVPQTNLDGCEVFNPAFAKVGPLPYGIVGGSVAGNAGYDKYNPTKRGLVFATGTLQPGMVLFLGSWRYTVDSSLHCIEGSAPVATPAGCAVSYGNGWGAGVQPANAVLAIAAGCDPDFIVNGVEYTIPQGRTYFALKGTGTIIVQHKGENKILTFKVSFGAGPLTITRK